MALRAEGLVEGAERGIELLRQAGRSTPPRRRGSGGRSMRIPVTDALVRLTCAG